jgi:divalent metal cation (Fe/Co/Zn/Cd) transporter
MRLRTGVRVEYVGSAWMITEAAGSIVFGLTAGSLALLAFGGDSLIELISGLAVILHLRKDLGNDATIGSKKTGQITSGLLFGLIPIIGGGAVYSFFAGIRPEGSQVGIAVAIGAVIIMPYLWWQKNKIGRETRSLPLSIDAIESITCFMMSLALLVGLLVEYFTGLWWVDYLATGVILAFVVREALESYDELHETEPPRLGLP